MCGMMCCAVWSDVVWYSVMLGGVVSCFEAWIYVWNDVLCDMVCCWVVWCRVLWSCMMCGMMCGVL